MRSWWKSLGMLAGGLASLGGFVSSAGAQFPPPGGGMMPGMGMPPGMMGAPPGMMMGGAPPGMFMGGGAPPGAFGGNPNLAGKPAEFPNPAIPCQDPVSPFSIKDEGLPNAWTQGEGTCHPLCFQFSVGYSLIWFRGANFPPLATTGSVNDLVPGALGQPGTVILSEGPRNPGPSAAFRATFTYWILDPERVSLDGDFFIMEQRSIYNHFASDATGNPPLFRPFFDPLNGVFGGENSDPRALPGVLSGTLSDSIRTRLMSADLNLRWHSSPHMEGSRASIFVGARWLRLDERYLSNDTALDIGGGGFLFNFSDNFTTYNQFFGGQVGADWNYQLGRFTLGLFTKVAVGPNYQTIKINGQATATDLSTGQVITDDTQALFAQPSNIGNYRKTQISVLSEFGAKTQIELNERIRLHCGYSFLWMTNTVRPGDQMDRVINNRQLPIGGAGAGLPNLPPALPGPPTFNQSQFYGHMLNLGLEITF